MGQRFEGRNLDEALGNAAQELGVERYRLTYHVMLEKRGFLGGMKRVVIEAEVNDAATPAPAAPAPPRNQEPAQPAYAPRESRPPRERGGRGAQSEDRRGGRRGRREGGRRGARGGRDRREQHDRRELDQFAPELVPAPEQGPQSEAAGRVRAWCEELLRTARLQMDVRTEETDERITLRLYGADTPLLVERNGELLDALQVLANKAMTGRTVQKDIEFDCAAFKERRVEELGERARETADRVRRDGREQLLPAMSPVERRIVHLALQNDAEVTTESRGEGFYKRVVVKLRPAGAQTPEA